MRRSRTGRAFTLIEITVVVTIMALLLGVVTLGAQALDDEARVQSAMSQLGSLHRLAVVEANRTGRPHLIQLSPHGLSMSRPVFVEGAWRWVEVVAIRFPRRVSVTSVSAPERMDGGRDTDGHWLLPIAPGRSHPSYDIVFVASAGPDMSVTLNGDTSEVRSLGEVNHGTR